MHVILGTQNSEDDNTSSPEMLGILLFSQLGESRFYEFAQSLMSIRGGISLSKANIEAFKEGDEVLLSSLGLTMLFGSALDAISEACDRLGIEYSNLKTSTLH